MIICICKGISDRQIRDAVARGVTTYEALSRELDGAGEVCGICQGVLRELLDADRGAGQMTEDVRDEADATPSGLVRNR